VRDEEGCPLFWQGVTSDVTGRKEAEEKLRASEAELRALFEAITDVILVLDGEGRYLEIAPTNPSLLYRPSAEVLGKTVHEIFPPEQADEFLGNIRCALQTRRTVNFEYSLQIDHRPMWFDCSISPMLEDSVVCVARDVTERKKNEEALRRSESRLAEAQRLARIGSWEWDIVTNTVVWSEELCHIYGLDPCEFEPSFAAFLELLHPDDREFVEGTIWAAYRNRTSFSYDKRIVCPDGEVRILHSQGEVVVDELGSPIRMLGTAQDVTEAKLAEEQILFQAHLLQQVEAAVIAGDLRGKVTHWNDHAERLYGWSRVEALGRDVAELTVGPEDAEIVEEIMERLRAGEAWEGEFTVRRKDGTRFPAYVTKSLIYDARGEAVGVVGVSTDISERKEAEEALRESEERFRAQYKGIPIPTSSWQKTADGTSFWSIITTQLMRSHAAASSTS
jgi:PAS domain S-box-containing protein